jgi:hypothetical protein
MVSKSSLPPPGGEPTTLQLTAVGQAPRNVVQLGSANQQSGSGVGGCSIEKDRAVVIQSGGQGIGTRQFWVVQLSTGRILWTRTTPFDGQATSEVSPSRDAQYIAVVTYQCCPASVASTTIYGPNGTVVGHVSGRVEAFSWDGALAVQMEDYGGPVSIINWRNGTVVWKGPSDGGYLGAMLEPGGQRIAISVRDPQHPQTGGWPPRNVYVVGPDGQAVQLLTDVI